jgi:YegS/Rv2252/BmrU family lipid kinase
VSADFAIIVNPASGRGQALALASRVRDILREKGRACDLLQTAAPGNARKLAQAAVASGVKTVVGCGGDGTLQEVAGALEGGPVALGLLPRGRCNDFAFALGITKKDSPEKLAEILHTNRRRSVDIGALNPAGKLAAAEEKRFLTVATLGFDSDASRFVETRKLWLKGTAAYLYAVLRLLPGFRCPLVRLKGDFGVFEGRVLLAATANSACYGGAMRIAPGAKLDDGLFQICVVREVSKLAILRILPRVLQGSHIRHPAVTLLASRWIEIDAPEKPLWICADGESMCQTPCRLEVRPGALQVVAP